MFTRWNLSRNPFDTSPISLGNLDWFVGRQKEVDLCRAIVAQQGVVLVEGGLGAGTTSFGNVVRFGSGLLTPRMEVGVYKTWDAQVLLENVLVALMQNLMRDPTASKRPAVKQLRPLVQRVEQKSPSGGVSVLGFGGQAGQNIAVTQPGIVPMETLRQGLSELAEEYLCDHMPCPFVIQLNNLDLNGMFSHQEMELFLNNIRDSLQLPGFSWLLVGDSGLSDFITHQVPRLRSVVAHDVLIKSFSKNELRQIINKRIVACSLPGEKGTSPIDGTLVNQIYDAAGGSLRDTFMICSKLCLAVAKTPFYGKIAEEDAENILAELQASRLQSVAKSPLQKAVLIEIGRNPGIAQSLLAKELRKSQPAVSRATKALSQTGLIRQTREGKSVTYRLAPEIQIAITRWAGK